VRRSIVIIINALHSGGAEKTCIEIVRRLLPRYEVTVVGLLIGGPAERELRAIGVRVLLLRASGPLRAAAALFRLARLLRECKPDVILTFLYFSDLIGALMASVFARGAHVYWNIRNNVLTKEQTGFASYCAARVCARVSRVLPYEVVYCSPVSKAQHEAIGYRPRRSAVVENSAVAVPFAFSSKARSELRKGRFEQEYAFLFAARFDPVKRVDVYIDACARAHRSLGAGVRFLLAGRGMEAGNARLLRMIEATGCAHRFTLLGFVADRQRLYSAADCLILTSESEGSPNVVYEAIATQLPVIILGTVGTEHIVADSVERIPTRDLESLAVAMVNRARHPVTDPGGRESARSGTTALHPLVSYYEKALSCE
jgi:glycosyltransferase involved in cell wall biosynthesis